MAVLKNTSISWIVKYVQETLESSLLRRLLELSTDVYQFSDHSKVASSVPYIMEAEDLLYWRKVNMAYMPCYRRQAVNSDISLAASCQIWTLLQTSQMFLFSNASRSFREIVFEGSIFPLEPVLVSFMLISIYPLLKLLAYSRLSIWIVFHCKSPIYSKRVLRPYSRWSKRQYSNACY